MNIEQMRSQLYALYPGMSWKAKVMSWPPNQVYAVYQSCLKYNRFNKRKEADKQQKKDKNEYYQYTIFDYI